MLLWLLLTVSQSTVLADSWKELKESTTIKCGSWIKKYRPINVCVSDRNGTLIKGFTVITKSVLQGAR